MEHNALDDGVREQPTSPITKLYLLLGIIAAIITNISIIVTEIHEVRKYLHDVIGFESLIRIQGVFLYVAFSIIFFVYCSVIYWVYVNFIKLYAVFFKLIFLAVSITLAAGVAVGSTLLAVQADMTPIVREQAVNLEKAVVGQQLTTGDFKRRFSIFSRKRL